MHLLKGASSLIYGSDGLGGIINFVENPFNIMNPLNLTINSGFQTNNKLWDFSIRSKGNFKNDHYWKISASYKKAGNYQNHYDGKVFNSAFHKIGTSTLWGMRGQNWSLQSSFSFANDDVGIVHGKRNALGMFVNSENEKIKDKHLDGYDIFLPKQNTKHLNYKTKGKWVFDKHNKLDVLLSFQQNYRKEYDEEHHEEEHEEEDEEHHDEEHEEEGHGSKPHLDMLLNTLNYNIKYSWYKDFKLGTTGMYQHHENISKENIMPDYNFMDMGAYAIHQKSWDDNFHTQTGIRYDTRKLNIHQGKSQVFSGLAYSLGARYRLISDLAIKLNFGKSFRFPHTSETHL